jgi:acyl-CoA synthetase (NDP forming)
MASDRISSNHASFDRARIDRALNPRTVVVVGDTHRRGLRWLRSMSTVQGQVYSVQLDETDIPHIEAMGVTNFRSLLDVPGEVDYVLVAVPRQVAPRILKDCIAKQVAGAAFFTSGFAETATDEGRQLQDAIAREAREAGLVVLGPNCMGLYNPKAGVRFGPQQPAGFAGPVTFL